MSDEPEKGKKPEIPPRKKKKKKKLLKTPSQIIRWCLVLSYVLVVYLLSSSYINATLFITDDLSVTTVMQEHYKTFADQKEVDDAEKQLRAAIDGLKRKKGAPATDEQQGEKRLSSAEYRWEYHISEGIDAEKLGSLIDEARLIPKNNYTDETAAVLTDAILSGQRTLRATLTISQAPLQLMFGGGLGTTEGVETGTIVTNIIMVYMLAILPFVGFLIASFDIRRHIKNIYSILCAVFCIMDIFMLVYPHIGKGAVASIAIYIIIFVLGISGFYAKQQEDYIMKHPELEAEYTEKHPHFVKALINYKAVNVAEMTKKEQDLSSARNAKEKKRKKRK